MRLNIEIDEKHDETSVTIQAKEWTEELEEIAAVIKRRKQRRLFGVDEEQTILLDPQDIDYIYAQKRRVFAVTKSRELELRMKLYEIEDILLPYHFMRFSKSVIGNLGRIERFELSFNGNLCVYFQSGNKEYITRKYVKPIKDQLMKGGQ
ncbi:LytTR family DNA-binding domain-containing protein [Oceanobacillus manasiensis]|uniref:LytTR family DNA-binding domain-containing protein n=1 Tax=Oceanobacillus manasiensis TaxID=586413 RepID=UPI0005AA9825|nr:LytTR family DNA-binding domain-containing protein [Oceanobacillus manasiensis]